MSLAERLGYKSLNQLLNELSANDIAEWQAYDLTQNQEWRDEYLRIKNLEDQKNQTLEEEAEKIKAMLMGLGKK
jgi:hypothetical protein